MEEIEDKVYEDERLLNSDDPDAVEKTIEALKKQKEVDIQQKEMKKQDMKNFKKSDPCEINQNSPLCLLQSYIRWIREVNLKLVTNLWRWKP